MECRSGCGACCIAPSITSLIPGMPTGKPAGERCTQLDDHNLCKLFGDPRRPQVCLDFKAVEWVCADKNDVAMANLITLEDVTKHKPS